MTDYDNLFGNWFHLPYYYIAHTDYKECHRLYILPFVSKRDSLIQISKLSEDFKWVANYFGIYTISKVKHIHDREIRLYGKPIALPENIRMEYPEFKLGEDFHNKILHHLPEKEPSLFLEKLPNGKHRDWFRPITTTLFYAHMSEIRNNVCLTFSKNEHSLKFFYKVVIDDGDIMFKDSQKTFIENCLGCKNTNEIFLPVGVIKPTSKHALLLIFNKVFKDIEIFDPMGVNGKNKYVDDVKELVSLIQKEIPTLKEYSLLSPNAIVPATAFQSVERSQRRGKGKVLNHFVGMCSFWVLWYIYYRLSNEGLDRRFLVNYALTYFRECECTDDYISRFARYVQDTSVEMLNKLDVPFTKDEEELKIKNMDVLREGLTKWYHTSFNCGI